MGRLDGKVAMALAMCVLVTIASTHLILKAVASLRGADADFDVD